MHLRTKEDLQGLIDNKVEESTILEFKSSFATENKKWKIELAKDVSAMANSNGGVIVFGMKQKDMGDGNAVAGKLTPIPFNEMTKDRLSQLLSSNIQPAIDNIEITHIPDGVEGGYYIVEIPQSNTAHQNRLDHIYYKRRNATIDAMEDYEVRDVMNRSKTPVVNLEFQLVRTQVEVIEKDYSMIMRGVQEKKSQRVEYELIYRPVNDGQIFAQYINYFIYIPSKLVANQEDLDIEGDFCIVFGDNTTRDVIGLEGGHRKYGPVRYDPILPGIYGKSHGIDLCFDSVDANNLPCIRYEVHADNAPIRKIILDWGDIELVNKTDKEIIDPMAPPRIPGY